MFSSEMAATMETAERRNAGEKHFRQILDHLLEGVQIIGFDWRYLYVNDTLAQQGKYKKEELLGYTMMEKYPGIEKSPLFDVLEKCMHQRIPQILENEFTFPDHSSGWFELSIQPVNEGIFVLSVDITARKKAEAEIKLLNEELELKVQQRTLELEAANKDLESFSYSVSHDLRAPLRAINGYAKMLEETCGSVINDEGKRLLGVVRENGRRMGVLIDELLNFSRLGRKDLMRTSIDMTELAELALHEVNKALPNHARVTILPLHPVKADRTLILQVLINLLSNAIKFSSKVEAPRIQVQSVQDGEETVYSVSDNGAGFDSQYIHKLFGVFERLHSADEFEGTGIGLALVHRIITKHGGKVWATGKENQGAAFYFSLHNPVSLNI